MAAQLPHCNICYEAKTHTMHCKRCVGLFCRPCLRQALQARAICPHCCRPTTEADYTLVGPPPRPVIWEAADNTWRPNAAPPTAWANRHKAKRADPTFVERREEAKWLAEKERTFRAEQEPEVTENGTDGGW